MFNNCRLITSLDLSSFNTSAVTTMQSMFYSCQNLTSLDVSNFRTNNCTAFSSMFRDCVELVTLNIDYLIIPNNSNTNTMLTSMPNLQTIYLRHSDSYTYDIVNVRKPAGATIVTAA